MTVASWIALGALALTLFIHTSALFYWGGSIRQMLRDHERRLSNLEEGSGV